MREKIISILSELRPEFDFSEPVERGERMIIV